MSEIVNKLMDEATNLDVTASMYTPGLQINRNNPYAGRMAEVCKRAAAKLRECAEAIAALQPGGEASDNDLRDMIHHVAGCHRNSERTTKLIGLFRSLLRAPAPVAVTVDDARDAARWRALLAGDRMRIMGWAGFDKDGNPRDDTYLHFGMEFWTEHDAKADPACAADTARCRKILTGYADRLSAALAGEVG